MPKYIVRSRTSVAPDAVWPLVSDPVRHGEWADDDVTVTKTGEGTYDSTSRAKGREFHATLTVLRSVPETTFAFQAVDETGTYVHTFTLAPAGGGTEITREVEATALSAAQRVLFFAVLLPVKKPSAQRSLDKLAALAAR